MKKSLLLLLLVFIFLGGGEPWPWSTAASGSGLWAQTSSADSPMPSTHFDMTGFPQWARDLRRVEVIAFGAFPFAYFFSSFFYDFFRCAANGWDRRYAPWPFDSADSYSRTQDERKRVILIAAGTAVFISLVDYSIVLIKRHRKERESRRLPPGTPIIIRTPLNEEEGGSPAPEGETPVGDT